MRACVAPLVLSLAACRSGAAETPPPTPESTPVATAQASLRAPSKLSLDELIDALPPTGCDFHRDPATGAWQEDPHSAALRAYVDARALSDEQWRRALARVGAFRCRDRWVDGAPWLVSLRLPSWIRSASIDVTPLAPGFEVATDTNAIAGCGICDLGGYPSFWGPFRGSALGTLRAPSTVLSCTVDIQRGSFASLRAPIHERRYWKGTLGLPIDLARSVDEILTPRSGPSIDEHVRRGLTFDVALDWVFVPDSADGEGADESAEEVQALVVTLELRVDEHRNRELLDLAIGFEVELLRDDVIVGEAWAVPMALADLSHAPHPSAPAPRGFVVRQTLASLPLGAADDPRERARWSLRVRGDGIGALALWDSKSYWKGELVLPLADALAAYESKRSER